MKKILLPLVKIWSVSNLGVLQREVIKKRPLRNQKRQHQKINQHLRILSHLRKRTRNPKRILALLHLRKKNRNQRRHQSPNHRNLRSRNHHLVVPNLLWATGRSVVYAFYAVLDTVRPANNIIRSRWTECDYVLLSVWSNRKTPPHL